MGDFGITGYLILAVYMVATVLLGLSFTRKQKNLAGYFLAERSAPWWAVGISVLACDLSAISYMGVPAWTYHHDLRYAMTILMFPLMAIIVAYLFIPFLARLKVFTIYEYLEHRFGMQSRLFASALFLLQRASHMAIAIYAISLALQQIVGWPVWACVTLVGALTTLYTVLGGMKAVLWTDVMQFFVLMGGLVVMGAVILWSFNGDVSHIWRVAAAAGHTTLLTTSINFVAADFWKEMTIWGLFIGTLVYQVGAYGSDQVLVQRYLAAGSGRMMARSLIFCGLLEIPVVGILYLLGLGFFAFYHAPENSALLTSLNDLVERTGDPNMVLPHFVRHVLPSGLAGLVFASLFAATMSVFSSGLNSLSTATCMDFVQRLRQLRSNSQELTLTNARWITLGWGILVTLAAIGVHFARMGSLLQAAATIIGFFSGPILGMFLLGIFTMRANSLGAILGAISGFASVLLLRNHVSFIWYPVAGCAPTLLFGYAFSFLMAQRPTEDVYPMTLWGRTD
ncbi:MAG: sodium/solute symporter [Verrucomicrobia bacterium]|nr:sodium/solute symporter [Verrucomicrobiota bacterium]